jgi:hypothetical protein
LCIGPGSASGRWRFSFSASIFYLTPVHATFTSQPADTTSLVQASSLESTLAKEQQNKPLYLSLE